MMEAEVKKQVAGEVKFGTEGLKHPTPMWATWIFRTEFILNKVFCFWLASTGVIQGDAVKETLLVVTCIDAFVWGMARFVGVKKSDFEA